MSVTYLELNPAVETDTPAAQLRHWHKEAERWIDRYNEIDDAIHSHNPFRDPTIMADLERELAEVSYLVSECAHALTSLLHEVDITDRADA